MNSYFPDFESLLKRLSKAKSLAEVEHIILSLEARRCERYWIDTAWKRWRELLKEGKEK